MITGHNTDVEYDGVVYHVQTEDKGLDTPLILSLVYVGGAILASKRSRYDDLIAGGFNEEILTKRLNRQHKLICAAVHAGRLEDLKRMSERDLVERTTQVKAPLADEPITIDKRSEEEAAISLPAEISSGDRDIAKDQFSVYGAADDEEELLQVTLLEDRELRGGKFETLRVLVRRGPTGARQPVMNARVVLKTLGTSFRPGSMSSTTDRDGVAPFAVALPTFKEGRAAILVRADVDGETAELRRIILPG